MEGNPLPSLTTSTRVTVPTSILLKRHPICANQIPMEIVALGKWITMAERAVTTIVPILELTLANANGNFNTAIVHERNLWLLTKNLGASNKFALSII